MPLAASIRKVLFAALAAGALLGACSSAPPTIAPPPPPPAPPSVALSPKIVELASAYSFYMARSTGISPDFADGEGVARSLKVGEAYEPTQMIRGAMAYAAVVALQDKTFVDGVRTFAVDPTQRRQVAYEILKDPAYAVGLPGSAGAAGLIQAALGGQAQHLYDQGKAVKQAAYDIQHQPWSKTEVAARDARLADAKMLSQTVMIGDVAETARLQQATIGAASLGLSASPTAPPYTPTVIRGLAIAALAALGEAGDANVEQLLALMSEPNIGTCMNMAKLNLYQCLAVAGPHYEDVFCLGQHAMMDTGRCMIRAAGLPEPFEAKFVPTQESIDKGMGAKKPPPKKARKKR
ncbi:MAG TPA: hypothetical protein VFH92_00820 [Phenylobacterium sp.]|nr:hypothetical protein [Phenylobacterium sp.]